MKLELMLYYYVYTFVYMARIQTDPRGKVNS